MNDLPVGRSIDETLRLLQAFQYTDDHDEVCPAGWKPGQDTVRNAFYSFTITIFFFYIYFITIWPIAFLIRDIKILYLDFLD